MQAIDCTGDDNRKQRNRLTHMHLKHNKNKLAIDKCKTTKCGFVTFYDIHPSIYTAISTIIIIIIIINEFQRDTSLQKNFRAAVCHISVSVAVAVPHTSHIINSNT